MSRAMMDEGRMLQPRNRFRAVDEGRRTEDEVLDDCGSRNLTRSHSPTRIVHQIPIYLHSQIGILFIAF